LIFNSVITRSLLYSKFMNDNNLIDLVFSYIRILIVSNKSICSSLSFTTLIRSSNSNPCGLPYKSNKSSYDYINTNMYYFNIGQPLEGINSQYLKSITKKCCHHNLNVGTLGFRIQVSLIQSLSLTFASFSQYFHPISLTKETSSDLYLGCHCQGFFNKFF
jgi:hypothetical protein